MVSWVADLDNIIFSIIKAKCYDKLVKDFPNIRLTMEDTTDTPAKFPTAKIKITGLPERGQDLEGNTINAVEPTVQIDILSNKSQKDVDKVMWEIMNIMKSMRFQFPNNLPMSSREGDIYRSMARGTRVIGNGDIL